MLPQGRKRLTECLQSLSPDAEPDPVEACRFGPAGEFTVRLAAGIEDRLRAWALAYRVYLEKEYARPNDQRLWYSLHDALPEALTVMIEKNSELIGAVTVVPDSPLGLPADEIFPAETAAMRRGGSRLAEAVSLVQENLSERAGLLVVAKLCELTCLVAQRLLGASDLVITVNPRHEDYYRRMMLFGRWGEEAACTKVSGAPAVFLALNFADMNAHVAGAAMADAPRTLYRRFMDERTARATAAELRRQIRPLEEAVLQRYFIERRPLLTAASIGARRYFEGRYPTCLVGEATISTSTA